MGVTRGYMQALYPLLMAPFPAVHSSHAFIDDLLFRSTCPHHIQAILIFFDTVGRPWGLDLNPDKTEAHAMGTALQRDFPTPSGVSLSTLNRHTRTPHSLYNYLDVYIFLYLRGNHTHFSKKFHFLDFHWYRGFSACRSWVIKNFLAIQHVSLCFVLVLLY